MITSRENICPKCHSPAMKKWDELDAEQKMLVERLPASADTTLKVRKKRRFCTRCWFEDDNRSEINA